jgi:DNA-binding CsgD family transcriptional regulator
MALTSADQRELYLPLIEGIHETPPFGLFMRNLVARTGARRAFLVLTMANAAPDQVPAVINISAPRATEEPPIDYRQLHALKLHPFGAMRPERVYTLDEMLDYSDRAQLETQRAALDDMGIRYGRWLRVRAGGAADAWLVLARLHEDFSASAVVAMAAIAPHLAVALRTLVALTEQNLQANMAQSALARLGVAQIAFDADARVMAADGLAEEMVVFSAEPEWQDGRRPGRKLRLLPDVARLLEIACAELAAGQGAPVRIVRLDPQRGPDLLLRRSDLALPEAAALPTVIGVLRQPRREDAQAGALALRDLHGLSLREAELAEALSCGEALVDAGHALGLTTETTRNYSKRIFSKTGATGQADLVRLVLTGLAPLA